MPCWWLPNWHPVSVRVLVGEPSTLSWHAWPPGDRQVFRLFKTSRTHMFLACALADPDASAALPPSGVVPVRSQHNFLAKSGKRVTGARFAGLRRFLLVARARTVARSKHSFCRRGHVMYHL